MNYWLGPIGAWIFSDGLYSILLYINRPGQTWFRDHSIRLIRCVLGLLLIVMGAWSGSG